MNSVIALNASMQEVIPLRIIIEGELHTWNDDRECYIVHRRCNTAKTKRYYWDEYGRCPIPGGFGMFETTLVSMEDVMSAIEIGVKHRADLIEEGCLPTEGYFSESEALTYSPPALSVCSWEIIEQPKVCWFSLIKLLLLGK